MTPTEGITSKLNDLIYNLDRLDIQLDLPSSEMTCGEYEDKREELIESCAKSIAELGWVRISDTGDTSTDASGHESGHVRNLSATTVGVGTCHMRLVYEEEDADGCIWPDHYECDMCGANVN